MNLLLSPYSNPYLNLATEEFLLKNCDSDFLFLYCNQPCVVVGKHQIAQKEVNSAYVFKHNILVSRRLSGGGAVYHDAGNLNFSFIRSISSGENISYKSITQLIVSFLLHSKLAVQMSDRNDIMCDGKKISGSAMHIFKNRVLAHGTLLINSDLTNLSLSLKGNPERYTDKSISSKRSKVMNLSQIDSQLNTDILLYSLVNYIRNEPGFSECNSSIVLRNDIINDLVLKKYSTIDWIYGYSPKYTYRNKIKIGQVVVPFILEVEKGIIQSIKQDSNQELDEHTILIFNLLHGRNHNYHSILSFLEKSFTNKTKQNIMKALF